MRPCQAYMRLTIHTWCGQNCAMIKLDYMFWRAPFSEVAEAVLDEIAEIDTDEATDTDVTISDILREAGVSISTWKRWKNGSVAASFDKFGSIIRTLETHMERKARGPKSRQRGGQAPWSRSEDG